MVEVPSDEADAAIYRQIAEEMAERAGEDPAQVEQTRNAVIADLTGANPSETTANSDFPSPVANDRREQQRRESSADQTSGPALSVGERMKQRENE